MDQGRNYGLGEKFWFGGQILGRGQNFRLAQNFKANKKLANFFKSFEKKLAKSCNKVEKKVFKSLLKSWPKVEKKL